MARNSWTYVNVDHALYKKVQKVVDEATTKFGAKKYKSAPDFIQTAIVDLLEKEARDVTLMEGAKEIHSLVTRPTPPSHIFTEVEI